MKDLIVVLVKEADGSFTLQEVEKPGTYTKAYNFGDTNIMENPILNDLVNMEHVSVFPISVGLMRTGKDTYDIYLHLTPDDESNTAAFLQEKEDKVNDIFTSHGKVSV